MFALAIIIHFWLPQMDLAGLMHARDIREQKQAHAQTAQHQIQKTISAIDKITAEQPDKDPATPDSLDQHHLLDQLAQLSQQDLTDPEKRKQAAQQLSEAHEQLAELALDQEQSLRPLENALTRLDLGQTGPADDFADALRRGDFDAAQQSLQDLAGNIDSMPESDRQDLAQQLESLTQQLQDAAESQQQLAEQASQQADQALQDAGMSQDQIDQLKQLADNPQALQEQLKQQGLSQQDAQNLAQQLSQAQRNSNNATQCQQSTNSLSEALKQMQQAAQNQQGQQNSQQHQQAQGQQSQGQQSQGQQAQGQNQQGQNGQQGQSFQRAADGAGDQLSELARMREQLSQLQRAQSQAQQSLNQLSQGNGSNQQNQQQGGGVGGQQAGTGEGGNPLGQHKNPGQYNVQAADDIRQGDGRIITSWLDQSPSPAGEPNVEYNQAVTEARQHAEKAVTEDRVPHRYHQSIRQYFDQIPESTDQIQSPPPAPN